MRWKGRRQSDNVEDMRGKTAKKAAVGGIGVIVIAAIIMLLGGSPEDVMKVVNTTQSMSQSSNEPYVLSQEDKELGEFVSVVLADVEDVWTEIFRTNGMEYRKPRLVLFSDAVTSACGFAQAATGPFYCPGDEKVYIDLAFFKEMKDRLNAPGDFAWAYVIAHEVGHHVQTLLGVMEQVQGLRNRMEQIQYNKLMVCLELQADFYAGIFAHYAERKLNVLEEGDIEEAMNAASAVGDDRLQKMQTGWVVPDSFTHGTSKQRMEWFMRGYRTGDISQGDTFSYYGFSK
jgi:hypothetical protein